LTLFILLILILCLIGILEKKALNVIGLNLSFYHRYVDDVVLAASSESTTHILNTFNSIHDRLKFTIEYEKTVRRAFSIFSFLKMDDRIIIGWYHKNFFSGGLSYFSIHLAKFIKIRTIYSLLDRAILLFHPIFQQKNIEICVKTLMDNDYPLDLIFRGMTTRLKKLFKNNLITNHCNSKTFGELNNNDNKKHLVIPYIHRISSSVEERLEYSQDCFVTGLFIK